MNDLRVIQGDCRQVLGEIEPGSVQCCVTSPPYWGLRDYGTAKWEGSDPACDHINPRGAQGPTGQRADRTFTQPNIYRGECARCGASRVDAQLGLEPVPDCMGWATGEPCGECYVCHMVDVFRGVRRVLRDDGTLWLNLGDSYSLSGKGGNPEGSEWGGFVGNKDRERAAQPRALKPADIGMKPKNLVGIPWRVAFALQADGWYLRSDIIWAKPNPMPESVTDRPTKAHEYLFLLSKSERYFYDADAVAENVAGSTAADPWGNENGERRDRGLPGPASNGGTRLGSGVTRNKRSVWTITTRPYSGAHFATFPPALIEPCIMAGTSQKGACATCGTPWRRETETEYRVHENWYGDRHDGSGRNSRGSAGRSYRERTSITTTGWAPTCGCNAAVVPCTVLDPFGGSGTTAAVAIENHRRAIIIELNPEYIELARTRMSGVRPNVFGLLG